MSKKTKTALAITTAARDAAGHLVGWAAVEAAAKKRLAEAQDGKASENFAEIHFFGGNVEGVIKAGNAVLKIQN